MAGPMRKRQRKPKRATMAAQRVHYDEEPVRKAKPKGRSVGGPWKRTR